MKRIEVSKTSSKGIVMGNVFVAREQDLSPEEKVIESGRRTLRRQLMSVLSRKSLQIWSLWPRSRTYLQGIWSWQKISR